MILASALAVIKTIKMKWYWHLLTKKSKHPIPIKNSVYIIFYVGSFFWLFCQKIIHYMFVLNKLCCSCINTFATYLYNYCIFGRFFEPQIKKRKMRHSNLIPHVQSGLISPKSFSACSNFAWVSRRCFLVSNNSFCSFLGSFLFILIKIKM